MYVMSAAAVTPCFNEVSTNFSKNSLLGNFQTGPEPRPTQSPIQFVPGFLPGDKAAEASSYSSPPSADVRNEWIYTSAPLIRPHGVERENFTLPS